MTKTPALVASIVMLALTACGADEPACATRNAVRDEDGVCGCPDGTHIEVSTCVSDAPGSVVDGQAAGDGKRADAGTKKPAIDSGTKYPSLAPEPLEDAGSVQQPRKDGAAASPDDLGTKPVSDASPDCIPTTEVCDYMDNDCDGQVDNGKGVKNECGACGDLEHPKGESCSNGGQGLCSKPGVYVCMGEATICNAPPASPSNEVCDNIDNDCDGMVDEGISKNECMGCKPLTASPGSACSDGEGECEVAGKWECMGTESVVCTAKAKAPTKESCDQKDNDCNGMVDEGCVRNACGGWMRLAHDKGTACTSGEGACAAAGTYVCMGTDSTVCNAKVTFPNLIRDPGFEEQSSFVVSAPWTNFMGAQIETSGSAHSGKNNASVTSMPGNSTSVAGWNDIFQRIQIEPNARYKLQAWVKTSANTDDLKIGARDGANWMLELGNRVYGAQANYTLLSTEFVASSSSADVYIGLHEGPGGAATTLQVDDVVVVRQQICP
ncbi:MAG: hypothetical protein RLZZ450_2506 [Pseudomonadota bacterium]|jgi:hypothetical protein